ncbi:asparagine synthase (glutamine-hydrolyzing) [Thermaerobacter sp. PB12/4term]|uniref:asparagine synthase (glutamine-hydrolyzing) n=1 Tax=Thermaerobacter sp. PB12/4term TaxID=2293838 RepID=UPI000E326D55|nr:asparagine synthase (glutamine-hydrolyzing) [Thermaerobacter sp. PB12/4term]QIA26622.1 asparagine synthase (glutamine-hydrolyzing) [Thermaerobacter sp. PB12/4term]
MCGIAGWIDWERDLTREGAVLKAMTGTLACRGPDDDGYWVSRHAAIGHRRLIVIDPAGGAQPMVRERGGGPVVLTYNGELYNTAELRRELESLGYTFTTRSDTEVVLAAYLAWGEQAPRRFNGIFAFAVWDEPAQRLVLARDHFGIKPLFYREQGTGLIFASELKGLLAHPAVEPVVDAEGLAEIFAVGPARTPGHGIFRGVREVLPGHYVIFDRRGLRQGRYWHLESRPHTDGPAETVATVRDLLADAVRRQLVSDVPLGTLLSGGLDSSAVTALAVRALAGAGQAEPLRTFSVDYEGNDRFFQPNDFQPEADAPYVDLMARTLGTRHRVVRLSTAALVEALPAAMTARDLPGMADIDASLLLFCQEIKRDVTVALSGECADEVFCGYPWFYRQDALEAGTFPWSLKVDARLQVLNPELRARLRPVEYLAERYREALAEVPRLEGEEPAAARRREIAYLTLTRWMPVLLDRNDRMSMAVGLEVRVPFCDPRLVEYVWNVPWELKTMSGREKGLLRHALEGILPPEVLWRKKSPYPKTFNPAYLAAMQAWMRSVLDDPASPLRLLIDEAAVRQLVEAEGEFDIPWFGQLMRRPQMLAYLAQVDLWLRKYKVRIEV